MSCGGRWFIYNSFFTKLGRMAWIGSGGVLVFCGINIVSGNEKFYKNWVLPSLLMIDGEQAHGLAIKFVKYCPVYFPRRKDPDILKTKLWGLEFSNPIGLAAGFDKDGEVVRELTRFGFGFIEIGSVTPVAQPGNEKPRVFRLPEDSAIINRYGFNSSGFESVKQRLSDLPPGIILGVNIGKNKTSDNPIFDYTLGVKTFSDVASYLVVNVSSPNTAGLRELQHKDNLPKLLKAVIDARNSSNPNVPVLVKISPDFPAELRQNLADTLLQGKVDGMIISNTTVSRPAKLVNPAKEEVGGLSGAPLKHLANIMIKDMYTYTKGRIPIIGVGGVSSGKDALEKIKLGASLVQIYTSLIYGGPLLVSRIKTELEQLLRSEGFTNVEDAVGTASDKPCISVLHK